MAQVIRYSATNQYSRAIERFHLSKDRNGTGKRQKCRSKIHGRSHTASRYDMPDPRIMAFEQAGIGKELAKFQRGLAGTSYLSDRDDKDS